MNPQNRTSFTDLSAKQTVQDTGVQNEPAAFFTLPNNTLRFYFTSSSSNQTGDVVFSSKLEGLEEEWSSWTPESERLFNSLPPATYTFLVKARTANNVESKTMRFRFRIKRQWYYSIPALISYGLVFALSIFLINRRQLKKVKTEAGKLKTEQVNLEEEIKKITHINTKQDRQIKEENLFSTLKPHLQTVHTFQEIQNRIEQIIPEAKDKELQHELKKINKYISGKLRFEKDWKRFSADFDVLHNNLLQRLAEAYPLLTEKDLRLCAYVQMDLKSKEIAPLMNITVRGVEVSRYRLRKKLDLENDTSLKDFIQGF
jgi:DNA-binding CsgD family transcriptional regulator